VKTGMGADTAEQLLTSGTQLGTCCTYVSMLHLLVYYVAPTCVLPVAHVAPWCLLRVSLELGLSPTSVRIHFVL